MKKAYPRIDFINCDTHCDYTICDWADVVEYVDQVRKEAEELDEQGFNNWKQNHLLPEVRISVVMMDKEEFIEWFKNNVEDDA